MNDAQNQQCQQLLLDFADYLVLERGLSDNTQMSYCNDIKLFLCDLVEQNGDVEHFTTQDVKDYMAQLHSDGRSATTVNRKLAALRLYVRFLIADNRRSDDPLLLSLIHI